MIEDIEEIHFCMAELYNRSFYTLVLKDMVLNTVNFCLLEVN